MNPKTGAPYPLSKEVDAFGTFVKEQVPPEKRGSHDSTVALVLSKHNGWSERPPWGRGSQGTKLWNYANIPGYASLGSGAVDGFFSTVYPGVGGTVGYRAFPFGSFSDNTNPPPSYFCKIINNSEVCPNTDDVWMATSSLPFGKFRNRTEAQQWFSDNLEDPAPYRPMADSRWGDIVDVLVDQKENWTVSALNDYRIVVWMSSEGIVDKTSQSVLEDFAKRGGIVVIPVGSLNQTESTTFAGVSFTGSLQTGRAWQFVDDGKNVELEMYNYAVVDSLSGSRVVAQSFPEKHPVVVRRDVGLGAIYTCAIPFFETSKGLSALAVELFDRLVSESQPVKSAMASERCFGQALL